MSISYTEAFNAFSTICNGTAKRSGKDKASGVCPVCGDVGSFKLWYYSAKNCWTIGCDHRNTCTFRPAGILSWSYINNKPLWKQLKSSVQQQDKTIPSAPRTAYVPLTATASVTPQSWIDENHRLLMAYFQALKPLTPQALAYIESRRLPMGEYAKWRWSPRTSAIVIPVEDRKGRYLSAKRRFIAVEPGRNRWSVVTTVLDGTVMTTLHKSPSQLFYGLNRINPRATVVICEGTFDALAFTNGISVDGVRSITPECVERLKRHIPDRLWCLDNDKDGRERQQMLKDMGEKLLIVPHPYKDANEWLCGVMDPNLDLYTIMQPMQQPPSGPVQQLMPAGNAFSGIFKPRLKEIRI